jgi:hypothetical protein
MQRFGMFSKPCSKCGRPLSNPVSIELGMGPICRVETKSAEANTNNLFSMRSSYDVVSTFPGALVILDMSKPGQAIKTVTNDIDNVLEDLRGIYGSLDSYKIMYRDSYGVYDAVSHEKGRYRHFYSLGNEKNMEEAYKKLMDKTPKTVSEE